MEEWVTKALGEVALIIMGQSPPSRYYNSEGLGSMFLQGCADFGKKVPNTAVFCSHPNKIAPKGAILFSVRAPVGRINFADRDYCIGRGLSAIIPEKIHPELLFYELEIVRNQYENIVQGSTFTSINSEEIKKIKFEIPSSPKEQTAIARILSTVDKTIEQTERLLAKYQRIKTGLMQDLLTRGIDEHGRIRSEAIHRFKDSPLGRIPEEWEAVKIGEIIDYLGSGITPTGGSRIYQKDGVMLIRSQNVLNDDFDLRDVAFIGEEINQAMKRSEVYAFDVLLNITGASIGRAHYIPINFPKANVNQHVCAIRLRNKTEAKAIFLSTFLNSVFGQNQILRLNAGSNREGLNYNQVKEIMLSLPKNENEFAKIAGIIKKQYLLLQGYTKCLTKLHSLKTALMQDLLLGRVRVPTDMIERIGETGEVKTA